MIPYTSRSSIKSTKFRFVKNVRAYLGKQHRVSQRLHSKNSLPRYVCFQTTLTFLQYWRWVSSDSNPQQEQHGLKQKQRESFWEHVAGPRKANQSSNFNMQVSAVMHSIKLTQDLPRSIMKRSYVKFKAPLLAYKTMTTEVLNNPVTFW